MQMNRTFVVFEIRDLEFSRNEKVVNSRNLDAKKFSRNSNIRIGRGIQNWDVIEYIGQGRSKMAAKRATSLMDVPIPKWELKIVFKLYLYKILY